MPKSTFQDFIDDNPNCKKYDGNPDAMEVFDILSLNENIVKMIDANSAGKPALTPCIKTIENFIISRPNPTIDLTDDFTKQAVGRMAKTILKPFGYKPSRQKDLPKDLNARYFKSATYYEIDKNVPISLRVVRHIEEV